MGVWLRAILAFIRELFAARREEQVKAEARAEEIKREIRDEFREIREELQKDLDSGVTPGDAYRAAFERVRREQGGD
jgi:ribosome recycling factor